MMTAVEVLRVASDAGMTFRLDGSKLRVHGGSRQRRAELAPVIAPLATAIASLLRECNIGGNDPGLCPACGYTHGALKTLPSCDGCGSIAKTVMLVMNDGTRLCPGCLRGGTHAS